MVSDLLKKNLLDLEYNKYLQYLNTCLILIFTFIIGILIAILSSQIDFLNISKSIFIIVISAIVIGTLVGLIVNINYKLKFIKKEISSLKSI